MPLKDQIGSTQGSSIQSTSAGGRSQCWSIPRILWTVSTLVQKLIIRLQDDLCLYTYHRWIRTVERAAIQRLLQTSVAKSPDIPAVCFVIDPGDASEQALSLTYQSIRSQTGCIWCAALLDPTGRWISWAAAHPDVLLLATEKNVWQSMADHLPGEWLVPLVAGDKLCSEWGDIFKLRLLPDADIIYWDEDQLSPQGRRVQPLFKPDWSPELLFSLNYLETAAFRKSLVCELAQPGEILDASWIFFAGQMARCIVHLPFVLTHRASGSASGLTVHAQGAQAYLSRMGYTGAKAWVTEDKKLRVSWESDTPLVSVIIPTRNNLALLRRCLETLFEKTDYPAYEVILMDDHSTDPAVLAFYNEMRQTRPNVHIYENTEAFNYSRVNNHGAAKAKGDLLLFLNNDVEILESGWLKEMVRWVQVSGVGMVGAKLLYPNGSIQHAGIVLGMTGHAAHVYAGKPGLPHGLFVSPEAYRNVSAVTGACMLVRRDIFRSQGGFDEQLGLVFNDVDLGVRFVRSGYRVVYTPAAVLIHYEGRSRARYIPPGDIHLGAQRLAEEIAAGDRFYNPNLSLVVNWPTLLRSGEPAALERLAKIARYKG